MNLVVNGWFWGQMNTGSGQYLHGLAGHLPAIAPNHRFTLVLPSASEIAAPAGWQVVTAPPAARGLSVNLAKLWFEQVTFPRTCRQLDATVAFVPYWGSPWQRPCRTAVTVHDIIPLLLPEYRGGGLQRAYTSLVSQTTRRAELVLTDSEASRRDIVEHLGIAAERVHAVLLAADESFRPVTDPMELDRVRRKYALPDHFILYLGGFDVRKNVPRLVQAYARWSRQELPTFWKVDNSEATHLVIAGKLPAADTAFSPDPRRVVADEGIGELVHFTGWVDEGDKPALYSLASLFAFPSLYEGFGLPAAEAAACGAPVLTSNRSSLPEAAPGAVLVDPEDVDALAAGLTQGLVTVRKQLLGWLGQETGQSADLLLDSYLAQPARPPNNSRRNWQEVARNTADLLFKENI